VSQQQKLEPSNPEQALEWLEALSPDPQKFPGMDARMGAIRKWLERQDAARAYLLKWANYGLERKGMMPRDAMEYRLLLALKDTSVRHNLETQYRAEGTVYAYAQGLMNGALMDVMQALVWAEDACLGRGFCPRTGPR